MIDVEKLSMTNVNMVNDRCRYLSMTSVKLVNDKCRNTVNDKFKVCFIQDHKGTPFEYFLGLFLANGKPAF